MPYEIEVTRSAREELEAFRVFDQRRIVDEMEVQLRDEPNVVTRRRKILDRVAPGFEHIPPLWELRVGEFRIFYDVDLSAGKVYVRAVRRKRVDQITEGIIK